MPHLKKHLARFAFLAAILTAGAPAAVAQPIDGSWTGSGYVQPTNGQRENFRCRVTYSRQTPKVYGVSAVCASPSANIKQTGEILKVNDSRYVGDFYNPSYDIAGRVSVTISGSTQTVSFKSASGSGGMTLTKR